jgi:hypothetical protein
VKEGVYRYCVVLLLGLILWLQVLELLDAKFSPADVRNVCAKDGGVENIVPRYGGSREAAIVICKDGGVGWVQ